MQKKTLYLSKGNINIVSSNKKHLKLLKESIIFLFQNYNIAALKINKKRPIFTILVSNSASGYNEFFLKENIFFLGSQYFKKEFAYKELLASLILHELKHLEQYQNNKKYTGKKAETDAFILQRKFLSKIKYTSAIKWLDKQYEDKWWEKLDLNSKDREKAKDFLMEFTNNKFELKEIL